MDCQRLRESPIKKTKKQHYCMGCGMFIPKGSSCSYYVGLTEGEFGTGYICDICNAFLEACHDQIDKSEGWEEGTLPDYDHYKPFKKGYEYKDNIARATLASISTSQ